MYALVSAWLWDWVWLASGVRVSCCVRGHGGGAVLRVRSGALLFEAMSGRFRSER